MTAPVIIPALDFDWCGVDVSMSVKVEAAEGAALAVAAAEKFGFRRHR